MIYCKILLIFGFEAQKTGPFFSETYYMFILTQYLIAEFLSISTPLPYVFLNLLHRYSANR